MHASGITWDFKVAMIQMLADTGLGYDTRYHYYRVQFPDMPAMELARLVCDPIEYYDPDWPEWRAAQTPGRDEDELVTAFFLERDTVFRREAQAAIYCFDEAGFGSGVNVMRFIQDRKPVLGFYHAVAAQRGPRMNVGNIIQLAMEYPRRVTLYHYSSTEEITKLAADWLRAL